MVDRADGRNDLGNCQQLGGIVRGPRIDVPKWQHGICDWTLGIELESSQFAWSLKMCCHWSIRQVRLPHFTNSSSHQCNVSGSITMFLFPCFVQLEMPAAGRCLMRLGRFAMHGRFATTHRVSVWWSVVVGVAHARLNRGRAVKTGPAGTRKNVKRCRGCRKGSAGNCNKKELNFRVTLGKKLHFHIQKHVSCVCG